METFHQLDHDRGQLGVGLALGIEGEIKKVPTRHAPKTPYHFKAGDDEMGISSVRLELALQSQGQRQVSVDGIRPGKKNHQGRPRTVEEKQEDEEACDANGSEQMKMRKKLKLSMEQSYLLEDYFKLHTSPSLSEKETLADQLKLKTRQVEVWFQNRRARSKSKQMEVELHLLKQRCENLSNQNQRLNDQLRELRSINLIGPRPSPTEAKLVLALAPSPICPSCNKSTAEDDRRLKSNSSQRTEQKLQG